MHVSRRAHVFCVWSAADVYRLRVEQRVVGSLIGALPFAAQQNSLPSLPLLLSYEELALLYARNAVTLLDADAHGADVPPAV